ncbi:uncharacterized protein LOC108205913 [Daucus carota subsp. sativus]|uniref:uncharacterized protein LOC108205913 n=1 Tax=Daucus carota subsp. sativus TaxID=79200 RepID=UPI003082C6C2
MDSEKVIIRLLHSGQFMKTKYIGDKCEMYDVERDYFSYSVLMEFVKELKYDEIGGVYIKLRGWKLVTDDKGVTDATNGRAEIDFYIDNNVDPNVPPMKQMQPHVIIRPKSSPFKVKEKNAEKRTSVTLQNINAEKTRRMKDMNVEKERLLITKKKLEFNHEDANLVTVEPSPKVIVNDVDGTGTSAGQACLVQSGGDKEMVKPVEGEGCNEYEMQRNLNVAKNQEKLAALGIPLLTKSVSEKAEKRELKQPNEDGGESDYLPTNEDAGESENDEADIATSKKIKKTKRQRVVQSSTRGPRTRGQAAKLVNKEAASEPLPREKNDAPVLTAKEKLQALKSVPGSMLAYNQLREREKSQIEKEIPEGESGTQQMMAESGNFFFN